VSADIFIKLGVSVSSMEISGGNPTTLYWVRMVGSILLRYTAYQALVFMLAIMLAYVVILYITWIQGASSASSGPTYQFDTSDIVNILMLVILAGPFLLWAIFYPIRKVFKIKEGLNFRARLILILTTLTALFIAVMLSVPKMNMAPGSDPAYFVFFLFYVFALIPLPFFFLMDYLSDMCHP
jgi:hypothetical protein